MSVEYTKNLYKQKITLGNYVQILEECCNKIISLDLINTVIMHIIGDKDQKRTQECLEIFLKCLTKNIKWGEVFVKSDFIDILASNRLEYDSYNLAKSILAFMKSNNLKFVNKKIDVFHLKNRFYNYALYKEFFEPHKFDYPFDTSEMDPMQISIYKTILREICISNRENKTLKDYLDTLNIQIDFLKAVVDKNKIIDITSISSRDIFILYPYQISNISNLLLCKFYLCSSNTACKYCGMKLLPYNYDINMMEGIVLEETNKLIKECSNQIERATAHKHRRFLDSRSSSSPTRSEFQQINEADFSNLSYFIVHNRILIDESMIKILLRATYQIPDNDEILNCYSHIDTTIDKNESVILYYVKNLAEKVTQKDIIKSIKIFLRIYDNLENNKKITFGLFVLLYEYYKEVRDTRFLRHFVLNAVLHRKHKLKKIIKWIFEYYISKINHVDESFCNNFQDLSIFLSEESCERFIEQHMNFIFPIIYSKLEFINFVEDRQFSEKYSHYIVANYIIAGDTEAVKGFYKEDLGQSNRAVDVLVPVLLSGFFDTGVFNCIYGDWEHFVSANIVKILFEVRKKFFEQFEQTECCIFHILRNILMCMEDRNEKSYRLVYPFIESFIYKGCGYCQDACVEVFVKFFVSHFTGISQEHIKRLEVLFDFDSMLMSIKKNTQIENINNFVSLVSLKGYLRKSFTDKALILFRNIFGDGDPSNDEVVITNYMEAFSSNIQMNRSISKIYDKIKDKELASLIGFIPEKLLLKEQKHMLKESPFLDDSLENIAKTCIDKYAMNIEIEDQDLHCFIIQEINKYANKPENDGTLTSHFISTKYTMNYDPVETKCELFKKSYGYRQFLENLFIRLLFACKRKNYLDFYDFFKYGNLLGIMFLEFSTYHLFNKVADENLALEISRNILSKEGVNFKIIKFLVNLDIYTKNKYFETETIVENCMLIGNYHYAIFLVESLIRKYNDRNHYNCLQYLLYKIGDWDRTRAINTKFYRINSINLFFEFILDRNLEAARDCLSKVTEEEGRMNIKPYLSEILNEKEEEGFLKQCEVITDDLSEWKNINSKNRVCLHFLKDCEMVEKSRDIPKTLRIITERRKMAGDDLLLIKCHEYLVKAATRIVKKPVEEEDISSTFKCSGMYSSLTNSAGEEMNFEQELNYSYIRKLIEVEDYSKSIKMISSLLSKKDWGVLYEFSELYFKQNKINKSKDCLKKILNLFPKTSQIFKKAYVRYAELVDTKQIYEDALVDIKDSSYLFLLYAKSLEQECPVKSIEFYINSILLSDEYKYETIPRMFHILSELEEKKNIKTAVKLVSNLVEKDIGMLLPFFSQILTRLNHKNKEIAEMVEKIILKIVDLYPKETHWKTMILMNSNDTEIKQRTKSIISSLSLDRRVFLNNIKKATELLSTIAQCSQKEISIKKDFPEFYEIINSEINVPNSQVEIVDIEDEVKIFSSLQAPKKVCFLGSDGRRYQWLCKYRDDLRKDSRFMELNRLINSLFSKNKSRNHIRTYEVIPFSHNYGIIEFIDGLVSLKAICHDLYSREGISISSVTKKFAKTKKIKAAKYKEVVQIFPPRFYRWFEENFSSPYSWFLARDNYTKTCAVMNIMGWFMGLGDRHADNILFDENVGDLVHVDLNSIFEAAKKLSVPEKVPFRLTQNIVDAFGVLGLEGAYSNSMCETLELFLRNKNIIISNLLSFVYDPLHEWRARKEKAPKQVIESLEKKLAPVDVTSRVELLNEEAISESNLSEMYIGWLPFI